MRALSVKTEWADLIRTGRKTIETRTWPTTHRGPLLICTTKPDGHARCIVNIFDCRPMTAADWPAACCEPYPKAWAWVIDRVIPVEPFPVKGQLSLYEVSLPAEAQRTLKRLQADAAR